MKQNVASQNIAAQMNSRTDGSPLTSAVGINVTIDGGTQGAGAGTLSHEGNGHWNYAPTQAETNGAHIAFQFTHATGVYQVVQVYTSFPQTGDGFAAATTNGAAISAVDTVVDAIQAKTDALPADPASETAVNGVYSNLAATLAALNDLSQAEAQTAAAAALTAYDPPTKAELDTAVAALPTAAENADAVWAEIIAAHVGSGTAARYLRAAGSVCAGKIDDAGTTTNTFRSLEDDADAVTATVDSSGNRSAVTLG